MFVLYKTGISKTTGILLHVVNESTYVKWHGLWRFGFQLKKRVGNKFGSRRLEMVEKDSLECDCCFPRDPGSPELRMVMEHIFLAFRR